LVEDATAQVDDTTSKTLEGDLRNERTGCAREEERGAAADYHNNHKPQRGVVVNSTTISTSFSPVHSHVYIDVPKL